jgi:hypothetical protein
MGRRRSRTLAVGAVVVASIVASAAPVAEAAPDRATLIRDALAGLDRADGTERSTATRLLEAEQRLRGDLEAESIADEAHRRAEEIVQHELAVTRQVAVLSYMANGTADATSRQTVSMVLSGRTQTMKEARAEERSRRKTRDAARRLRSSTEERVEAARQTHDAAEAARSEREREADSVLSAAGAGDLPAISYLAYRATADEVNQADPQCRLPAAVLAAIGRVRWRHGWQSAAITPLVVDDSEIGAPRDPYDIQRAITPIAARLCALGGSLDQAAPLATAVRTTEPDPIKADIVLAVARRYSRTAGLDLGSVPAEVTEIATVPLLDDSGPLPTGDIAAMVAWGRTRVGTPYSQCLGSDIRPQDPVCPPGTNRFGRGWFDCSGFVSAAYRKIGIIVPSTTMAMDANERFMATRVATTFDPEILRTGDVFLMDGHTGIYVGEGFILHARDAGLTLERIPAWVANATYAILRPSVMR